MEAVLLLPGLDTLTKEGEEEEKAGVSLLELMRMEMHPKREGLASLPLFVWA